MNKKLCIGLVSGVLLLSVACVTRATTLTFDDIITDKTAEFFYNYGGFVWDKFGVIHREYLTGSAYIGYYNGVVSGDYAAYSWSDNNGITRVDSAFDFTGAYFTARTETDTLTILGYRDDSQVYSTSITIKESGPKWFQANWSQIDKLSFVTASEYQVVMDDFTVNENSLVPEPATILLLGSGIVGLAGFRLRRKSWHGKTMALT